MENEISKRTGFGKFDPPLVAETWKGVAGSQDYPADKINPESVVDRSLLQKLSRRLRLLENFPGQNRAWGDFERAG